MAHMRVLLVQLDGKLPNIALMRLSAHHKSLGDTVELRRMGNPQAIHPDLFDGPNKVYASAIFERTRPMCEQLKTVYPDVVLGGTGWDVGLRLEDFGITTKEQDYSLYPRYPHSIGFSQRGCRLKCSFCVVPRKEGAVSEESTIADIWRGDPHPRNIVLLDNDFFGQPNWDKRITELQDGDFKVSFNQGINARMLTEEAAEAIASVRYSDDGFKTRRIYTAWDNRKDEKRLFRGLEALVKHGVKPDHIMVYILIGFWPNETVEDWLHRQGQLRAFGARPYPMPYVRTKETVGFQRWVIGAYDKRVSWDDWVEAAYQPRALRQREAEPDEEDLWPT